MPDPFDPTSYEQAPPFDPQTLMQGPGQTAPQPPKQGFDKQKLLRLIPLVAAAAKGGPGALEGLLSGYQQAEQQRQRQATTDAASQRQAMLDESLLQNRQFEQQRQVAEFHQKQAQARAELAVKFSAAVSAEGVDDPAVLDLIVQAYEAQGRALGVRPGAFRDMATSAVTPGTLTRKAARKKINELRTQFSTKWMEEGAKFTHELPGVAKPVTFPMLLELAGMQADPNAKPPEAEVPNTDYGRFLARYAKERGKTFDTLTVADEAAAKKLYGQADDQPRVSVNVAADNRTNARIDRISAAFNSHPIVKEYNEIQSQQGILTGIVNGAWSGPGDMAAVFAFMKALDPNSVVRETEYANAAKSGNIFAGWAARFNGALSPNGGFLSERVRRDFLATINARMSVKSRQYQNLRKQLVERVDRIKSGAPETGDEALVDYSTGSSLTSRPEPGDNPFRRPK